MLFAVISTNSCTYLINYSGMTSVVFTDDKIGIPIYNTPQVVSIILCYIYSYIVLICLLPYALL